MEVVRNEYHVVPVVVAVVAATPLSAKRSIADEAQVRSSDLIALVYARDLLFQFRGQSTSALLPLHFRGNS